VDPTQELIARGDAHLEAGLVEIRQGHLNQARAEFDKAVDVYLTAPGGAYANETLGDAYRRTLEAINLRELEALAVGDGFTEALPEPASIDEVGGLPVIAEPASEEARRTAEEAVAGESNDLPIDLNDAVLSAIELYQGRLRDWFAAALARGGRYLPLIREVFAAEGLPQDLAYVALVESAFKTGALSRAKAKGVWQFMPSTGRDFGLRQDWWVDERSNVEKATRAAARYLKRLYGIFGDWNLVLASYNAGEGKVLRQIDRYGTADFWRLRQTRAFKPETRNYVPLIHAAIVVAKAPEVYGFDDVDPEPALRYDNVPMDGAVDLRTIAECVGSDVDAVQGLNPELRRLATPAYRTFDVKVPEGTGTALVQCLQELPADKRVRFRTHVVGRGQTLASIARKYRARLRDLADANGLSTRSRLPVGAELIIPIDPRPSASALTMTARRSRSSQTQVASSAAPGKGVPIKYRIKPGDTLGAIAAQYGTTVPKIRSWNGIRGSYIAAGDVLTIYTSSN
jgi:membrane-bound lytic murein transglycosylase D